ncbi:MAG: hypothetical protein M1409_04215, partial [Actinobacteria bacterium]|nr:hypothetical protein [Actinomycetota bacterium]
AIELIIIAPYVNHCTIFDISSFFLIKLNPIQKKKVNDYSLKNIKFENFVSKQKYVKLVREWIRFNRI